MNINVIAPINSSLGYGITSTHIVDELVKLGHSVALFPIGRPETHPRHEQSIRQALDNADHFDVNAPCLRLWHQFDMSMFVGKGTHIGFPIFELDTFTPKEKHHLCSCDRLFVCSEWAKNVIDKDIIDKFPTTQVNLPYNPVTKTYGLGISVIPLGVDINVFTPKKSTRKPTIFLNIGKWEVRKGHDVLVDIFNSAFNETDHVELWMMNHNPFYTNTEQKSWESRYRDSKLGSKIRFLPHVESDNMVADIMQQADCGVFPSRAEGWNLEALEMLACGKNLIITNYSAHTEFCTTENSFPVPIKEVEPAYDGKWFFRQGSWAKLGEEQINLFIHNMRWIHAEKQSGHLEINEEGINTAHKFTWKNTAETIIQHLS